MNSRERFFNLLQGKPFDRRPFGALLSLYGAGLTNCPLNQFYNDAAAYARGQDAVRQTVCPDFLLGPFLLAGFGEAFGSTLHYTERSVPTLKKPAICSVQETARLVVPDPDTHPRLLYYREAISRVASVHGSDTVIVGFMLSPIDLPILILGLDAWLFTVLTDESGTRRLLEITTDFFVRFCEKLFSDGADAIALPMPFFTRDITTKHLVTEFAFPALQDALKLAQGPFMLHHTGSSFFDWIDLLETLPGVMGFSMDLHDDLTSARKRIRQETILFSGQDGPSLHTLTPGTIKAHFLELLSDLRNDRWFVPFLTGTDVEMKTPLKNLLAFRQAVEECTAG